MTKPPSLPPVFRPQRPNSAQAPPLPYRPPSALRIMQSKPAKSRPVIPPVYRPAPRAALQPSMPTCPRSAYVPARAPIVPAVYRPTLAPTPSAGGLAQRKVAGAPPAATRAGRLATPTAPPPYRPHVHPQVISRKTGWHVPRTIQRLAINLQPDDNAVEKLIAYAQTHMGVTEKPVTLEGAYGTTLGTAENVYLFGHGGTSDITVTTHDRFGRLSVDALAQGLAHITFPEKYSGTVYMVGCKTDVLIDSLKKQLHITLQREIDVRGTAETLQTTKEGGIVERLSPQSDVESGWRQYIDLMRSFHEDLRAVSNGMLAARKLMREITKSQKSSPDAEDAKAQRRQWKKELIVNIETFRNSIKKQLTRVDAALLKLEGTTDLLLENRREGLNSVKVAYGLAAKGYGEAYKLAGDLLTLHETSTSGAFDVQAETKILLQMFQAIGEARDAFGEEYGSITILIQMTDTDLMQTTSFGTQNMDTTPSEDQPIMPRRQRRSSSTCPGCCCIVQ